MTVEVVIRLPDNGKDIEDIQDAVKDALYAAGFSRIEPIRVTLVSDTTNSCGCVG